VTYFLTREDVLAVASRFGARLADVGLLDAAIGRPQATVFGQDAYASIWDKAAALLHSLAANQQVVDGNKRVAWNGMELFLDLNGYAIKAPMRDAHEFMVAVDHHSRWQDISRRLEAWQVP
jgi:death-on-curing protein